jgi:hypothetical protein
MKSAPLLFSGIFALTLHLAPVFARAAATKAPPKASAAKTDALEDPPSKMTASMGRDKAGIEAYLKDRLAVIRSRHKAQEDFNNDEAELWQEFWNKSKEERELFEVRISKQRLNVFESLDSLDQAEHGMIIADFERMQSNVLKSFETAQKTKMTTFFASQAERLKAFAAQQQKDRVSFAEDAEASWRQLKSGLPSALPKRP